MKKFIIFAILIIAVANCGSAHAVTCTYVNGHQHCNTDSGDIALNALIITVLVGGAVAFVWADPFDLFLQKKQADDHKMPHFEFDGESVRIEYKIEF